MDRPARILATADPAIVRCLGDRAGTEITAGVGDADRVIAQARAYVPDIAIIGLPVHRWQDLAVIERIREAVPGCRILAVVARHVEDRVVPIISAGASGYLRRENLQAELADAVAALRRGEVYYDPDVTRILATRLANGEDSRRTSP